MPTYYKMLGPTGEATHDGSGHWYLPKGKRPGKWMPRIPDPVPCERGYHVVTQDQLLPWLNNKLTVYRAEIRGAVVKAGDKSVAEQARLLGPALVWNWRIARLFAADCAERVLPPFERIYPHDNRPRKAIEMSRAYANGAASAAASDTASDTASAAAWAAAWAAASAAERRWQTTQLMAYLKGQRGV